MIGSFFPDSFNKRHNSSFQTIFKLLIFCMIFSLVTSISLAKSYKIIVGYENEELEIPIIPGRVVAETSKMPSLDSSRMKRAFPLSPDIPTIVPKPNPPQIPHVVEPIIDHKIPQIEWPFADSIPTPESLEEILDSNGRVIVAGVTFEFDSANLTSSSIPSLQAVLGYLQNNPDVNILIEGHCDTSGDTSLNPALSQARADSVRDWLIDNGIKGTRLKAIGRSDTQPIADNSTPEGQAKNRRVELVKE
jgi:outer membrane protein OmpA-like peptidoglycan-associated protein